MSKNVSWIKKIASGIWLIILIRILVSGSWLLNIVLLLYFKTCYEFYSFRVLLYLGECLHIQKHQWLIKMLVKISIAIAKKKPSLQIFPSLKIYNRKIKFFLSISQFTPWMIWPRQNPSSHHACRVPSLFRASFHMGLTHCRSKGG